MILSLSMAFGNVTIRFGSEVKVETKDEVGSTFIIILPEQRLTYFFITTYIHRIICIL